MCVGATPCAACAAAATARQEAAAAKASAYEKIRADEIARTTKKREKPRPAPPRRPRPGPSCAATRPRSKFAVGSVVAEVEEPHSALEVVATAGEFYTLSYRDAGAWRGHEITRLGYQLVAFGADLPRRSKQAKNYCED